MDCHFICEALAYQDITVPYISTKHQTIVVFTKALSGSRYQFLFYKLMLLDHSTSMRGDVSKIDGLLCVTLFSLAIYAEIYIVYRHKIDRLYSYLV
jgi:hypothetical protein